MMNYLELYAVRHGETAANAAHLLQGQTESPLSELGRQQAEALATRLENTEFQALFSSDLSRAVQTAVPIAMRQPGLEIEREPLLREWNLGKLEGRPQSELMKYPELLKSLLHLPEKSVEVPGGESTGELQARVDRFMNRMSNEFFGERILAVTHGGVLQCMFQHVMQCAAGNMAIRPLSDNASFSIFRCFLHPATKQKVWRMYVWNDISHLSHLPVNPTFTL